MKTNYLIFILFLLHAVQNYSQNVGIGTNSPNNKLEIKSNVANTSGLRLTNLTSASPTITANGKSLSVDANGDVILTPSAADAWSILGNAGTTAGTNFLGTTDAQDLVFKTNNSEKVRILTNGFVGIGTINPSFYQHGGTNRVLEIRNAGTATNDQSHLILSSMSTTTNSSIGSITWALPNATSVNKGVGYIGGHIGLNSTAANPSFFMNFSTRDITDANWKERLRISESGNVGIGTAAPTNILSIVNSTPVIQLFDAENNPMDGTSEGKLVFGTPSGEFTSIEAMRNAGNFDDVTDIVFKNSWAPGAGGPGTNLERMRINYLGNVGIGTAAPSSQLHVSSTTTMGRITVEGTNTGYTNANILLKANNGPNARGLGIYMNDAVAANTWYTGRPYSNGLGTSDMFVISRLNAATIDPAAGILTGGGAATGTSVFFSIINNGYAGIGTVNPQAQLDVTSTTNGFAMPRMTSAQRKAITAPINGLQVYDLDLQGFYYFNGTQWDCVSVPAGTVNYFGNITSPVGYLECNGQAVNRVQYAELFNAIGTLYGSGDGTTTFNLPDLRGEFIRGIDNGKGADVGRTIGSFQQGTHITGDNGAAPATQGIGNLTQVDVDPPDGTSRDIYYNTATTTQAFSSPYWGRVRPRNVALLPCIKY